MIYKGDCKELIKLVPDKSVNTIITSPPYWGLRDYGVPGQLGLEQQLSDYIANMTSFFAICKPKLADDGGLWIVIGDCYAGSAKSCGMKNLNKKERYAPETKPNCKDSLPAKCLYLLPERLALALVDDGWILRSKIVWHKPNSKPENIFDRPVNNYEHIFFFTLKKKYYYNQQYEGNHIMRAVWDINTTKCKDNHPAAYPLAIPMRIIDLQCPIDGIVLDPFTGSGTTAIACQKLQRRCIGFELNPYYVLIAKKRILNEHPMLKFINCM